MACKHFQQENHDFNKHAKFTIIDQLMNTSKSKEILTPKSKETLTQQLIESDNFWILKLDRVYLKSFNMELSK